MELQQLCSCNNKRHNYVRQRPKVSHKNCSTAVGREIGAAPCNAAQSDENETSNYTKPTLNNSPFHPRSRPSTRPTDRPTQFNSLFTGRTTLCSSMKGRKKKKNTEKKVKINKGKPEVSFSAPLELRMQKICGQFLRTNWQNNLKV